MVVVLGVDEGLSQLRTYSEELGLDLSRLEDRFKWFLASLLFAKRISAEIAKKTYHQFEEEGLPTVENILVAGWDRLVQVLDSGGYVRYDFSTASNLLRIITELKEKYGTLDELHRQSKGFGKALTGIQRSWSRGREHIPERTPGNLGKSKTKPLTHGRRNRTKNRPRPSRR